MADRTLSDLGGTLRNRFHIEPASVPGSPTVGDYFVGDLWMDSTGSVWRCIVSGNPGTWALMGGSGITNYQMELIGKFNSVPVIPFTTVGVEIISVAGTLTSFRARRGVAGSAGTTTIQLEKNGVAVVGATLSWPFTDANFTLKSVATTLIVAIGDYLSFRLTAKETNGEDIFAEAD